jgi:diguanylate cyclase (GGDEF)-like protein
MHTGSADTSDSSDTFTRGDLLELDAHCVKALLVRARKATMLSPIGTLFVFWLVRDLVALDHFLIWMVLNTLPDALTFALSSWLIRFPPRNERIGYWHNLQLALRVLQGLSWGSAVIFFHVAGPSSLISDMTILVALIAVSAAGIVNTAPSFRTSVGFSFAVLIFPICFYYWLGEPLHIKLATGCTILLLVELQFGWDAYRQFLEGAQQLVLNRRMSLQLALRNKELDELNRQLCVIATHDKLTCLYNRHFVVEQLERQFELLARYGNQCSIVMFDIDHFKLVNDRYGHTLGDQVLVAFSRRIESQLRLGDTLARYGGEEFLLVLPMTDLPSAIHLAERIRSNLADTPLTGPPQSLSITASFGVAQLNAAEPIDAWLNRADQALYRAKNEGRNCVVGD